MVGRFDAVRVEIRRCGANAEDAYRGRADAWYSGRLGTRLRGARQGLREIGYVENRTIVVEIRYGGGVTANLPRIAAEFVDLKVDVIVTANDTGIQAAKNATQRIPIVMANSTDPVGTGFVASLARPGGNITGLSFNSTEITSKRLELLKELVPGLARVGFLWSPELRGNALDQQEIQAAASALRLQIHSAPARQVGELETVIAASAAQRIGALVVAGHNPVNFANRRLISDAAARHRLPTVFYFREYVDDGGLISYGGNNVEFFRRAAVYVDKILKGAKPADLPIEQPTKYEMIINLKTAKTIGLEIPRTILERADEVIE